MKLLRDLLAAARARLAARADTEHEQAIVRLVVSAAIGAYLLPEGLNVLDWGTLQFHHIVFTCYFVLAAVVLGWIFASNTVSHVRRCLALAADIATTSIAMWYYGDQALAMFLVYVWVTLANGFRFGPNYLVISLGASLIGFAAVLATTVFWQKHLFSGVGMALGHIALPAATLAFPALATLVRFTRAGVLEVMQSGFVLYERAMGLPPSVIVWKYILRSALTSTVTQIGLLFGILLAGAVVTETVFDWPGIGTYAVNSIIRSDYNAVMGFTVWAGTIFLAVNLLVDLAHTVVDPRERMS